MKKIRVKLSKIVVNGAFVVLLVAVASYMCIKGLVRSFDFTDEGE